MRLFGVILAGGQGRRMGGADKALLRLAGVTLVARAVERLEPQVERLAISANGDAGRFGWLGLPVLADDEAKGPLSGVLAGMDWAAGLGARAVVTVAVDCPFFPGDLVPQLALAAERSAGGVALARWARPFTAVCQPAIDEARRTQGRSRLIRQRRIHQQIGRASCRERVSSPV